MTMRKKKRYDLSALFLLAGIALLIIGLSLGTQPVRAARAAADILTELKARIVTGDFSVTASDMPTVEIGGYQYIGYLTIPEIDRELPIMSDWSDEKLTVSPCRYYGSIETENMVLAAHNYPGFFGHLKELSVGAELSFNGADGQTVRYVVAEICILPPSAVEEMVSGEYPLTLFTCTEDEKDRLTVRCEAAE